MSSKARRERERNKKKGIKNRTERHKEKKA